MKRYRECLDSELIVYWRTAPRTTASLQDYVQRGVNENRKARCYEDMPCKHVIDMKRIYFFLKEKKCASDRELYAEMYNLDWDELNSILMDMVGCGFINGEVGDR